MTNRPRFGFALEYVPDIEAGKRFYMDVLGLTVEREHPTFVQFIDSAGNNYAIASDEAMDKKVDLELYWLVDDADAAFQDLASRAEITLPLSQMPFGKVFGVRDPAGQPRYLLQFAGERPSRRVT